MNFENYINQAWANHGTDSQKVADGFTDATMFVENSDQLLQLVALVTHVMGEHLGNWNEGQSFLAKLREHKVFTDGSEADKAIRRSVAVMRLGQNEAIKIDDFGRSDQVRVLAVTSSALSQRDSGRAKDLLLKALDIARHGLEKNDPANRALAVTGNNLASALEEKKSRTSADNELMVLAARTGREFWEIAGGWLEVSRAEYRLASSYLEAGDVTKALHHAQACLEICRENKAGDLDMFFAFEVLAKGEKARQNNRGFKAALEQASLYFEKLTDDDKQWCEPSLKKLRA